MSSPFDLDDVIRGFSGQAPLFPLPGVVFFPHILLPLHIFEPRYRAMLADVLDGEQLIAMAQVSTDEAINALGQPPRVPEVVCLGKVIAPERLPDGRYNLLLQGVARARVRVEEDVALPYRVGRLDLCPDQEEGLTETFRDRMRHELLSAFRALHPDADQKLGAVFAKIDVASIPLGVLCDLLAYAGKLPANVSQSLLEEVDVAARSELLLDLLKDARRRKAPLAHLKDFPPRFSRN